MPEHTHLPDEKDWLKYTTNLKLWENTRVYLSIVLLTDFTKEEFYNSFKLVISGKEESLYVTVREYHQIRLSRCSNTKVYRNSVVYATFYHAQNRFS